MACKSEWVEIPLSANLYRMPVQAAEGRSVGVDNGDRVGSAAGVGVEVAGTNAVGVISGSAMARTVGVGGPLPHTVGRAG